MVLRAFGPVPTPSVQRGGGFFLQYFSHFWNWSFFEALRIRGMSKLLVAVLEERVMLDPFRFLRLRVMSKLLWAPLEVKSFLVPDFSWDVQATFGTFGSKTPLGS